MKKVLIPVVLLALLLLAAVGCQNPMSVSYENGSGRFFAKSITPDSSEVDLIAGRHINAGTVKVTASNGDIVVAVELRDGWILDETHLAVALSFSDIPQTKKGNPIPGKFEYSSLHSGAQTSYVYTVPLVDGPIDSDTPVFVAMHAAVSRGGQSESAWAGGEFGQDFPGKNWATYFVCSLSSSDPDFEVAGTWTYLINGGTFVITFTNTDFFWNIDGSTGGGEVVSYNNAAKTALVFHSDHPFPDYKNHYMKMTWSYGPPSGTLAPLALSDGSAGTLFITMYAPHEDPDVAIAEEVIDQPTAEAVQTIEIAGTWTNVTYDNVAFVIDSTAVTYMNPALGMHAQVISFDNESNSSVLYWTDHPLPDFGQLYTKFVWTDPDKNGFISYVSVGCSTPEEAAAAVANSYPSQIAPGVVTP